MSARSKLAQTLGPWLKTHPALRSFLVEAATTLDLCKHSLARSIPRVIRPQPRVLTIAVTANCNARCHCCRYGRDFMLGRRLPLETVREILDDAAEAGFETVRLYGGEPLLHPDLPRMVEHCCERGLKPVVITNGTLLERRVDDLHAAGLREIAIGFYGVGEAYDRYTQRQGLFAELNRGLAYTRQRYGSDLQLGIAWLLMRPNCNLDSLRSAWRFAEEHSTSFFVNLIHHSASYFTAGPDREFQFRPEDRPALQEIVGELLSLRRARPDILTMSERSLRSIPDWLLELPAMQVPCTNYRLLWIGADGTVQLCFVTFPLGNVFEKRLSEMLFTHEHAAACSDAFRLNCPNCVCSYPTRIDRHSPSRRAYARP